MDQGCRLWHGAIVAPHLACAEISANPRRVVYLGITLMATVGAWLILAAMASAFLTQDASQSADTGVRVANARSAQQMLPLRYAERLSAISGVRDITYLDLSMIECPDGTTVTINALGGSGSERAAHEDGYSSVDIDRWKADPLGVLIGAGTAHHCGWTAGTGVSPTDAFNQQPVPMHVVGIAAGNSNDDDTSAIAHFEYFNRSSHFAGKDRVIRFTVTAQDAKTQEALAARIEAEFVHDDPPVTAYPDTTAENARARFGKVQYLLIMVMIALFACCALALTSVMAHVATERRPQLAVLRVLGFPRRVLLLSFALELAAVMAIGTLLGAFAGWIALNSLPESLRGLFGVLHPAPWAWRLMPLWLGVLLVIALIAPSIVSMRVRPTDAHR